MAWVEKDHYAHPVPTPCYGQGHQPAAQAAQSHIQPGNWVQPSGYSPTDVTRDGMQAL